MNPRYSPHPALTYHNAIIENISIEDVTKSLSWNFTFLRSIFQPIGYLRKLQQWDTIHVRSWIYEIFVYKYFNCFSWLRFFLKMANSFNLPQKRTWDPCKIYDGALAKIIVGRWNLLTVVTTSCSLDAAGILGPAFSYGSKIITVQLVK